MNNIKWFIVTPTMENDGITYRDGKFVNDNGEVFPAQEIQNDMKVLEKYFGKPKIVNGIIDDSNFIIYDAANAEQPTSSSYRKRLKFVCKISCAIDILGLENIQTLPIYYIGSDQNEIPKCLDYAKKNGYSGVTILRDLPFGEINKEN